MEPTPFQTSQAPQNPLSSNIKGRAILDRVIPQTISRVKKVPSTSSVGILRFAAAPHLVQLWYLGGFSSWHTEQIRVICSVKVRQI